MPWFGIQVYKVYTKFTKRKNCFSFLIVLRCAIRAPRIKAFRRANSLIMFIGVWIFGLIFRSKIVQFRLKTLVSTGHCPEFYVHRTNNYRLIWQYRFDTIDSVADRATASNVPSNSGDKPTLLQTNVYLANLILPAKRRLGKTNNTEDEEFGRRSCFLALILCLFSLISIVVARLSL